MNTAKATADAGFLYPLWPRHESGAGTRIQSPKALVGVRGLSGESLKCGYLVKSQPHWPPAKATERKLMTYQGSRF